MYPQPPNRRNRPGERDASPSDSIQQLHTRLVAHVKQTDSTLGNVVLDAIEGAHVSGDLERLVAAARRRPAAPPAAGLFVRTVPRGSAEASVPVEIQLHAQAVTQIDKLVKQHQADNRTQLITVALQAHL